MNLTSGCNQSADNSAATPFDLQFDGNQRACYALIRTSHCADSTGLRVFAGHFKARHFPRNGVGFSSIALETHCAKTLLLAIIGWLACVGLASGQTLNLPPRATNALGGQAFVNVISPMLAPPDAQRENWIYAQVASGNNSGLDADPDAGYDQCGYQ